MKITVRLGAQADGTLTASWSATCRTPAPTATTAARRCSPAGPPSRYTVAPTRSSTAYSVYTNTVPSGALRGYGMTQPTFAVESAMNELALALDMDPLELRRRNIVRPGDALWPSTTHPDE